VWTNKRGEGAWARQTGVIRDEVTLLLVLLLIAFVTELLDHDLSDG
jgi:hypothetical protein